MALIAAGSSHTFHHLYRPPGVAGQATRQNGARVACPVDASRHRDCFPRRLQ